MWQRDIPALVLTLGAALIWLRINDFAAHRGWIDSRLSRKIIHIGTGPLFVLCWLLFSPFPWARALAALTPLLITIQFTLVGLGILNDPAAVEAMSRTGDRREILRGPLYYGIVFVVLTLAFWLDSPSGVTALMMVCGGDGLADILGRRFGKAKLPWNRDKSWVGSAGFFFGGWILALLTLAVFVWAGVFPGPIGAYVGPVSLIALAATLIESISPPDWDNVTIAVGAVALGMILF
jgi:phytol kinase